jgi:hypothetical protein
MFRKTLKKFSASMRGMGTLFRKSLGGSDYKRWSTSANLSPSWDARTKRIANLIEAGTSVIEFGAGRLVLKAHLPEKCSYTPSDLVDRGEGTIICDLNSDTLPGFPPHDVAVFSGVLEYVNDVPRLILSLSGQVKIILTSYAVSDKKRKNRRVQGWVNDYSTEEVIEIFKNVGFQCEHSESWQSQMIFKFVRK